MIKNLISSFALLSLSFSALAGDWTNWRGPNYNGATTATGLPTKFSKTKNIAWKTALPGASAATPIVAGDRVFLTAAQIEDSGSGKGRLLAMCLDRKSGKILWERNAGSGYRPNGDGADYRLDNRTNYASPSAVTDGETVIFFFGNGDLIAYSLKGDLVWRRNIQKDYGDFTFQWTFAATPTLYEDKLYLPILQRNEQVKGRGKANSPSYILAMDPKTGKTTYDTRTDQKKILRDIGLAVSSDGATRAEKPTKPANSKAAVTEDKKLDRKPVISPTRKSLKPDLFFESLVCGVEDDTLKQVIHEINKINPYGYFYMLFYYIFLIFDLQMLLPCQLY